LEEQSQEWQMHPNNTEQNEDPRQELNCVFHLYMVGRQVRSIRSEVKMIFSLDLIDQYA
jgi:hypothetical protein